MKVAVPPPSKFAAVDLRMAKNGDIRGALAPPTSSDPNWKPWVTDLHSAYDAYWSAYSAREDQAAYHEILLFGGRDGYASDAGWFPHTRAALARLARRFACWVEVR